MLRLPQEIIEKIFYHCDQTSFINLSQTCRRLQDIYKTYSFNTLPKYIGTIKIIGKVDYEDEETPFLNNRIIQNKIFITHDINELKRFFVKYINIEDTEVQDQIIKVRKIKCSFSEFDENSEIELFNNNRFHSFVFDYKRRADVLNEYLFNEYINNAPSLIPLYTYSEYNVRKTFETEKDRLFETLSIIVKNKNQNKNNPRIEYIKKYIGRDKLIRQMYLINIKTEESLFAMSAFRTRFGLYKIILTSDKNYKTPTEKLNTLIEKRNNKYQDCFFDWINTLKTTKIIFNKEYNFHKL